MGLLKRRRKEGEKTREKDERDEDTGVRSNGKVGWMDGTMKYEDADGPITLLRLYGTGGAQRLDDGYMAYEE